MQIRRSVVVALLLVVPVAGCGGSESGEPERNGDTAPATRVTAGGTYEVGVDIAAGVYTAVEACSGHSAGSKEFDLETDTAGDDFLAAAMPVGDRRRIELHDGEFFTTESCDVPWVRDSARAPAVPDPATTAGACTMLVGDGRLAQQALGFPRRKETARDQAERMLVQEQLFTVVSAGHETLADPAGQLVDYLDDPVAYWEDGELDPIVLDAFSTIRTICQEY